jgi:hypothetical protein
MSLNIYMIHTRMTAGIAEPSDIPAVQRLQPMAERTGFWADLSFNIPGSWSASLAGLISGAVLGKAMRSA